MPGLPRLEVIVAPDSIGRPQDRHLYAMTTPSNLARGYFKIGITGNILRREKQLSCGQPEELRACFVWPHEEALESHVLRSLPSPGLGGRGCEWRVTTVEALQEVVSQARQEYQRRRQLPASVTCKQHIPEPLSDDDCAERSHRRSLLERMEMYTYTALR